MNVGIVEKNGKFLVKINDDIFTCESFKAVLDLLCEHNDKYSAAQKEELLNVGRSENHKE